MGEFNHDQGSFEIASEEQLSEYLVTPVTTGKYDGDGIETIRNAWERAKSLIHENGGLTKEDMDSLGLRKKE